MLQTAVECQNSKTPSKISFALYHLMEQKPHKMALLRVIYRIHHLHHLDLTASLAANGVNGATAELTILEGASVQGSPNYDPNSLTVRKGDKITVTNKDNVPHTVTSGIGPQDPTSAKLFDTSIIEAGATADIATGNIDAGNHPFYCSVHPYMTGTLVVDTLGSQESNNRKLADSPYAAGQNVGATIEEQLNLAREKVRAAQK